MKNFFRPMRSRIGLVAFVALWTAAGTARALGPHEILLLVNARSEASEEIAKAYARLRRVPAANIVRVNIPLQDGRAPVEISPSQFTEWIWDPARQAAMRNGVDGHVLAWVYSADFPVRVATDPPMSLTGITFARNRSPVSDVIKRGAFPNPLFAGPNRDGTDTRLPQTLDVSKAWLGDAMPLPAMMLGVSGPRGNTVQEILASLRRGQASDGTRPDRAVYFVVGDDIRARERTWQFPGAVKELRERGVHAEIVNAFPSDRPDIVGLMTGAARVTPVSAGRFRPGAMADHLTSFAAAFDTTGQTPLSDWIRAGATVSAGTVTEPYALWMKFPHARFFVHYAAGCTALESFYQAIRSPLQILPVGDPLAQPWAPRATLTLDSVERGAEKNTMIATITIHAGPVDHYPTVFFLLDGRPLPETSEIKRDPPTVRKASEQQRAFLLRTGRLQNKRYALRAVGIGAGSVRNKIFDEQTVKP